MINHYLDANEHLNCQPTVNWNPGILINRTGDDVYEPQLVSLLIMILIKSTSLITNLVSLSGSLFILNMYINYEYSTCPKFIKLICQIS